MNLIQPILSALLCTAVLFPCPTDAQTNRREVLPPPPAPAPPPLEPAEQAVLELDRHSEHPLLTELQVPHPPEPPALAFSPGTPAKRTLVLQPAAPDPKALSALEEDLAIMSRILNKAISGKTGDEKLTAMGIYLTEGVKSLAFPGDRANIRNLYLAGYGALFVLSVDYPLVPPADKPEQNAESSSDAWEDTRRELFGGREVFSGLRRWAKGEAERYDPEKVEALKENLLQALKHASNIRDLKPDEFVTVAVLGPETRRVVTAENVEVDESDRRVSARRVSTSTATGETVLMIRVKKSDAEAFAKGDLKYEAFKQTATVAAY